MPPHLHPRSTATSTLFAGTLLASFVVVAIPHLVPCPRPRGHGQLNTEIVFDEQGKPIRKMRKVTVPKASEPDMETMRSSPHGGNSNMQMPKSLQREAAMFKQLQQEEEVLRAESKDRECPVPKPKGVLGKWLGFEGGKKHAVEQD